jgi:hypothetical protein
MLIIECELPYSTRRIDCLFFGEDEEDNDNVVVVELKQWDSADPCEIDYNLITTIGGSKAMVPHPAYQVKNYHNYLKDFMEVFEETEPLSLSSCVYCHNYSKNGDKILLHPKFEWLLREFPVFTKEDYQEFADYLKRRLKGGRGLDIFNRFVTSNIRPSKKLLEHTKRMIQHEPIFNLIDEQLTANNTILDRASKCVKSGEKSVIIIRGGPGTGKSVIAVNIFAELADKGIKVFHATGSAAFTTTLRKIVGPRASQLFKYFLNFPERLVEENAIDVLICDEAHRIRKSSSSRFTPRQFKSSLSQVEELIRSAKISVFFIDDYQVVRPNEIGSASLIRETAEKYKAKTYDFELKTQFRCSGSDGYLNWVDNFLGIRDTANHTLTRNEKMEFHIFETPEELDEEIKKRNKEKSNSARLVAGFCWPWSDPNADGTLKEDVVIGNFRRTWEAKNEAKKLAPGIPRAALWAYDPNGVNQVGSIYTIQGFEFDYVGVIWGRDLIYDPKISDWVGKPENSADATVKKSKETFLKNVKNTYRVLLTRGMAGCYVYFMDKDTENFVRSRIELAVE